MVISYHIPVIPSNYQFIIDILALQNSELLRTIDGDCTLFGPSDVSRT
jgi:hypothetical protein